MTQFIICLVEYCCVFGLYLAGIGAIIIFVFLNTISNRKPQNNKGSIWVTPWWDVWNFYYANLFSSLNKVTRTFFQISWNEWHVLDIRMFFLSISIIFVTLVY